MFTTTLVVALAGFVASTTVSSPQWQADYRSAQRLCKEGSKPMAVFVGHGKEGWNRISQEGELNKEVKRMLEKYYICVYVDTEAQEGRQLARDFEIPQGIGLVISDRTGSVQAFHHQGDLPNGQLLRYLGRYADPHRVVRATEMNPGEPEHYYAPAGYPVASQPSSQPIRYSPIYVGRSGGSC